MNYVLTAWIRYKNGELPDVIVQRVKWSLLPNCDSNALKQRYNLGYADAFAAELAVERGAWLVTADPEFSKLGKALSIFSLPRHEK